MTDTTTFAFARPDADPVNIRTVQIDGEPWFAAIDVCRALGLPTEGGAGKYMRRLDGSERQTAELPTPARVGGKGPAVLISESGLYKLIMRSDKGGPGLPALDRLGGPAVHPQDRQVCPGRPRPRGHAAAHGHR